MGFEVKKLKIMICVLILVIACIVGFAVLSICNSHRINDCGAFSLQTYADELQTDSFMSDKKYDKINNYRDAAKCAGALLQDDYSLNSVRLSKYRTEVYFDEESNAWLVYFTLKPIYVYNELAADYYVIISANGDIIARWGVK